MRVQLILTGGKMFMAGGMLPWRAAPQVANGDMAELNIDEWSPNRLEGGTL